MNKRKRSTGVVLHTQEWLGQIHSYSWADASDAQLAVRLHACGPTPEAYSILKEIIQRKTGLSLFDTQLLAALSMAHGRIAELPTGEGKTLAAVVTAALLALQGKAVHILVFNDYLAQRDYDANRLLFQACGLTCGCITEASGFAGRKAAYGCQVVYIAAKEAGFDCLRDFLCMDKDRLLAPPWQVALVDEADSILIDEARIPLVLAGNAELKPSVTARVSRAVQSLSSQDVGIQADSNQVWLTDAGFRAMEALLHIEDLSMPENANMLAMINAALEARYLLKRDKDYIVQNGAILVVDEATGRVAENRRFPDLLHQAVEIQALGKGGASSVIYNSMSIQAYLRQYSMLCGMTGTAASSAYEFRQMYGLEIDVIAPHAPCIRIDHPDAIFAGKAEQEAAILAQIQACRAKGQPVLMGTQSVQESEHYAALLSAQGIPHNVLNARNNTREAAIVAEAGRPYQVTISTNMAGRGVDIRLGGRGEAISGEIPSMAQYLRSCAPAQSEADFVRSAGGLFVISTGINRSLRVDNQLRGRAGRQGDPGESRFFVCLEDISQENASPMALYTDLRYPKLLRRAQREQERKDIEARYMLERYSSILEGQRKRVTEYRTQLLLERSRPAILAQEDPAAYQRLVATAGLRGVTIAEKQLALYFINMNWASYLEAMEAMRDGIHLLVVGRKSPLDEYMFFAVSAFDEMLLDIRRDVVAHMKRCTITDDGIDLEREGLLGATTTWTYMINESTHQFSRIPQLIRALTSPVKGTLFTVQGVYAKLRAKWRRKGS